MWATLDEFLHAIIELTESGFGYLQPEVFGLTSIMIVITFAMLGIKFALSAEEGKAVLVQFFFTLFFVGFMTFVIKNWPTLYKEVGGYFQGLGGIAGNVGDAGMLMKHPSRILDSLDLAKAPIENAIDQAMGSWGGAGALWNQGKVFSLWIAAMFLDLAFVLLYLNMFFAIVEFHIICLAAWPFLAFSAFKGTSFLAERPIGFVFASGAKLFVMTMVLGFSLNFFNQSLPPIQPTIGEALGAAIHGLTIMVLGLAVPVMAAALISGGPGLSAALPMMTAIGAAMAMKEGVQAAGAIAQKAAGTKGGQAIKSATAEAAGRAATSISSAVSSLKAPPSAVRQTAESAGRAAASISAKARQLPQGSGDGAQAPTKQQWSDAKIMGTDIVGMTRSQAGSALNAHQKWFENQGKGGKEGEKKTAPTPSGASTPGRGSNALAGMKSAYNRSPSRSKTDFLQRVRSAIPPGTEGQASGATPSLSRDII
jgi:type IV secretion system protein TrbL